MEDKLDELDLDIDIDKGDGKLVITFDDNKKFILSRQGSTQELWLAEPSGGWHFALQDGKFICDKRGVEILETLEKMMSEKLSEAIHLT